VFDGTAIDMACIGLVGGLNCQAAGVGEGGAVYGGGGGGACVLHFMAHIGLIGSLGGWTVKLQALTGSIEPVSEGLSQEATGADRKGV